MGFFSRLSRHSGDAPEADGRNATLSDAQILQYLGFGHNPEVAVSEDTATSIVAVLSCLRVRIETFAGLPCHVYQRDGESRGIAEGDPIERLLARAPNDIQTPFEFWSWKQYNEDVYGNAYAMKVKTSTGRVVGLWPLLSAAMRVVHKDMTLIYRYSGDLDVPARDFLPMDIVHFRGSVPSTPYEGASLVDLTSKTLGLGAEAERFFHNLLSNGTHFPNYIETDTGITQGAIEDVREQLDGFSGLFEAGRTRVFPPGLHVKQNPMSLKDMDFSPQLRWNLEQISRIWRIPLPLLNDLTHGTYTNSEQAALWLEQYTVSPICTASEQTVDRSLLGSDMTKYLKFNMDSLRRGDYKTRTEGYSRMVNMGAMTRNEVRAKEELNPLPGLDKPIISLANGTVDPAGETQNPNILAPVVRNAAEQMRTRFARDGDTERTRRYARMVAAPVVETLRNMGMEMTVDQFIGVMTDAGPEEG